MMSLDQQTIVVIGGSSGIGYEVARQTSAQGARLIIAGRNQAKLDAASQHLAGVMKTAVLDAHDETALEGFFSTLESFDHLVSMVGDSMAGGFLTTSPETMRHTFHSKFFTNWLIARFAAPKMNKGGSMTFTAGTGGRPHEVSATYVANLALGAMVQGLAVELAPYNRVNAVSPTFMGTRTQFWKQVPADELKKLETGFAEQVPHKRIGTVEEVASAYVYLMKNGFINGQVLAVDGGVMLKK